MKKKFIWISLAIVTLLVGTFWGVREIRQSNFNKQFHKLNLAIIEDIPTIDTIGHQATNPLQSKLICFSQKNHAIDEHISHYLDHKKLASEHLFSQEWIVLYPKTSSFNLRDSNAYDLIEKTYHTEGLSVRPSKEKVLKTFYTTADGKEITLNDIVADKVTFRKTLKEILPETTEKQALEAHEQLIKSFEGEDWSAIDFSIKNNTLILNKATVSLSIFVNSLNPAYFTEAEFMAFQEQETERQELNTGVTIHYGNQKP